MRIIDAHSHIFPDKIAKKATESIGGFYDLPMDYAAGGEKDLLASIKGAGIENCVVCSTATRPEQVESINDFLIDSCKRNSELIGLAAMSPLYGKVEEELDRVAALGLKGVKLHPDFQAFRIDDESAMPIYAAAQERGLPILFHTGDPRYEYSRPHRLARVARLFPRLTCIGAHFGGWKRWDELDVYKGLENVFFDTSSSLDFMSGQNAAQIIRDQGAERFMFGCDFPMWEHKTELERFHALPIPDGWKEQILHTAAERIFGV